MNKNNHPQVDLEIVLEEKAKLPIYASTGASGADVEAYIEENIVIPSGESRLIPTGLKFAIPEGFEIQVRPRSGLALKSHLTVLNTPGTIDADYRGELKVILMNFGKEAFTVTSGMRIAQIVLVPVVQACFLPVQELSVTVRGSGGFGHTGLQTCTK